MEQLKSKSTQPSYPSKWPSLYSTCFEPGPKVKDGFLEQSVLLLGRRRREPPLGGGRPLVRQVPVPRGHLPLGDLQLQSRGLKPAPDRHYDNNTSLITAPNASPSRWQHSMTVQKMCVSISSAMSDSTDNVSRQVGAD